MARQELEPASRQARRLVGRPAKRELVPTTPGASARWHVHSYPGPYCRWNHHPEYEVHLIQHGTGRFIVGDHIGRFSEGQLVLVGSNLPHHWISDLAEGEVIADRDIVFQFHPRWVRDCRKLLPELQELEPLLTRSGRGIVFSGRTAAVAAEHLVAIGATQGIQRLQHILAMLASMGEAPAADAELVATTWVPPLGDTRAADVVDQVIGYIVDRTGGDLRMAEAAAHVGMSESAFSRYFSRTAGQSFSDTVRKLRLAQACQLLEHSDQPVARIAHHVGYRNLSNFNRQFRAEHGLTPTQYRRAHYDG